MRRTTRVNTKEDVDVLKRLLKGQRLEKLIFEFLEEQADELDKKYFQRVNYAFEQSHKNWDYIKFVDNGLQNHASHDFYRDMMLEQRIATLERKFGISPPESLWLRSLKDDKISPDKLGAMKDVMKSKYRE